MPRVQPPRSSRESPATTPCSGSCCLHGPLGFETAGRGSRRLLPRGRSGARGAADALRARRVRHALTTDIPEGDPLEAYRAASRPFAVGRRLWIEPGEPPTAPRRPRAAIALRVPASRAFGTGSHASTRLALLALEDEALEGRTRPRRRDRVGRPRPGRGGRSARGWPSGSTPTPTRSSWRARTCARHAFGDRVRLFAGPLAACAGEFDLVVANMLAEEFLPEARRLLGAGRAGAGRVLLSGVTREREPAVLAKMRTGRWKLAGRRTEDEWSCLCLSRAS